MVRASEVIADLRAEAIVLPSDLASQAPRRCAAVPVRRYRLSEGVATSRVDQDWVIEEAPVALVYNGISQAVMLATPGDWADFGLGFSLSEGILSSADELYDLQVQAHGDGWAIEMEIATRRLAGLQQRQRALAGRTGCGLCGSAHLDAMMAQDGLAAGSQASCAVGLAANSCDPSSMTPAQSTALQRALLAFDDVQTLRHQTGAAHGAAFCNDEGELVCWREDVGRHNALDKLVGALAHARLSTASGFVVVSSRASYEMVLKAAVAGVSTLVALSAPTALAVRAAQARGIRLLGFARAGGWVGY